MPIDNVGTENSRRIIVLLVNADYSKGNFSPNECGRHETYHQNCRVKIEKKVIVLG